jgi:hypothetical protein
MDEPPDRSRGRNGTKNADRSGASFRRSGSTGSGSLLTSELCRFLEYSTRDPALGAHRADKDPGPQVDGLSRTPQATRNGRAAGPKSGTERNKERRPLGSTTSLDRLNVTWPVGQRADDNSRRLFRNDTDCTAPQATRNGRAAGPKSGTERNKERRPLGSELSEVWKYHLRSAAVLRPRWIV